MASARAQRRALACAAESDRRLADLMKESQETFPARRRFPLNRLLEGYLYLVPALLVLGALVGWPLFEAWRMSFYEIYLLRGIGRETFVGIDNFVRFALEPDTPTYFANTAIYVLGGSFAQLVVAMILALLLNRRLPLRAFWRALAIVPWAMPLTMTALVWRWILDGQWGILNYVLRQLGIISQYISWLSSPIWLWPSILLVDAWAGFPFVFVNLLSGLQGIPREIYEAARIDGAGPWTIFWRITVPMMRPIIGTVVLLSIIMHLRDFATIWMLTSGGPGIRSTTLSPLVYVISFRFFKMGYGASIGIVLMLIGLIFTMIYLRRIRIDAD
jgi:multiple sugar transport system permease protein